MANKYMMVGIGNPVFDIIETPYVRTETRVLSGCSINAALAVGKLGGNSLVIGSISSEFRDLAISKLKEYNVEALFFSSRETGGFYLQYIGESMNDRKLRLIGRADPIPIKKIDLDLLNNSKSVLFGPILDEINVRHTIELIEKLNGVVTMVDPQGYIRVIDGNKVKRVFNKDVLELIGHVDIFKPNEHEAKVIFGDMGPIEIARKIRKLGAKIGIVTLAERGSIIATEEGTFKIPAYRTIERDPTGCGDVYGGAFLYYYIINEDPIEAAVFASAAASFMVESSGPDFKLNEKIVFERFNVLIDHVEKVF